MQCAGQCQKNHEKPVISTFSGDQNLLLTVQHDCDALLKLCTLVASRWQTWNLDVTELQLAIDHEPEEDYCLSEFVESLNEQDSTIQCLLRGEYELFDNRVLFDNGLEAGPCKNVEQVVQFTSSFSGICPSLLSRMLLV